LRTSSELLTLDVDKPAAGGRMLARHDGQVVLVWGAIPGERVRARIERAGKGVLFAETIDVVDASPDRRSATADWRCGGNVLAHVDYRRQLRIKSDIVCDAFTRIARMPLAQPPDVMPSPEQGYRMRARLHVRGGRIGFMREESHELCAVGPTGQLLPETVAWIDAAQAEVQSKRLEGLTSIEIAENAPATERACYLELVPGTDARPFGGLVGAASVTDRISVMADDPSAVLTLRRDARAFFQGNRFLLEELVRRVIARVEGVPILDLYAGVGLFGLSLAAAGAEDVTLVEGDRISGRDLEENARPYAGRARVARSSVEDFVRHRAPMRDAVVIVDPPRTGMSKEALGGLIALEPARLIYVSCDVATLARDARTLTDADYTLAGIEGVDLFPNTAHVETIAVFQRAA
jgi:23S rRNA (uracil1939-C5)-methyltransferase